MNEIAERARDFDTRSAEAGAENVSLGALANDLGFYCRLAQLHFFEAFFDDFHVVELSPAELSALLTVKENPGIRQGLLAEVLLIKRSAMTKLIRGLENRGLITRVSPPSDRRSVELTLTSEGEALAANASTLMKGHGDRAASMLDTEERKQLMKLLKKVSGYT